MRRVLYPGSFDPMTNGHLDLVERASKLFDEVIVGVAVNRTKDVLFSLEERAEIIKECTSHMMNVQVKAFDGLLVDAIVNYKVNAILRGLRAFSDFEYELQMALMNRSLNEECETIFMMPTPLNSFVSSSIIKETALLGGDYSKYVPEAVSAALAKRIKGIKNND
ncbi:MAG: pantetheine-phosphate adenylyltransferase [Lentisphaerae bacterium]|nr:pantetheine-phosphate adenylyltransferase [Lentisphaerota bacterium]MCP4102447.1 pantetheine-phosphate adenylyltransferase [Lentisphaerota bacterium]